MLQYKIDILHALKEKGYTSYKIRKDNTKLNCNSVIQLCYNEKRIGHRPVLFLISC